MKREVTDYLVDRERGFLATVNEKGEPTVVPVCYVYSDGFLYTAIDSKPKKTPALARVKNVLRNSSVAFATDTYSEDWRRLSYALVHGVASIVHKNEERERVWRMLRSKYPQYRWLRPRGGQVIKIRITRGRVWRFTVQS